jgi:hypothetical protein
MAKRSSSVSADFLTPAPEGYKWPRCADADSYVEQLLGEFLKEHAFARHLSERMLGETSSHFSAWVDHLRLPARRVDLQRLVDLGFVLDKRGERPAGSTAYWHPYADLPRLLISPRFKTPGCAIMVDDIWRFQLAHGFSLLIEGAPYAGFRSVRISERSADLYAVERRGSLSFVPVQRANADAYVSVFEMWANRPRRFDSDRTGMKHALALAQASVKTLGTGMAAHAFLEAERAYWESRNRAARVQKARQDALGLGWANHDHHTFRSSRAQFAPLIQILLTLGFKKRERYYAGSESGWGAQIMEQPEAGVIIFADVDLAPGELSIDFSKEPMPELKKPSTVGLWCALHGESMLEAGMHHLEAKFDFERLRTDLKKSDVDTMPPFSDFTFLRQAFTKAEMWPVGEPRLKALHESGRLSDEAAAKIRAEGAVGSHLENLQRREGFKGFNQRGVSDIISAVHPEKQALQKREQGAV